MLINRLLTYITNESSVLEGLKCDLTGRLGVTCFSLLIFKIIYFLGHSKSKEFFELTSRAVPPPLPWQDH